MTPMRKVGIHAAMSGENTIRHRQTDYSGRISLYRLKLTGGKGVRFPHLRAVRALIQWALSRAKPRARVGAAAGEWEPVGATCFPLCSRVDGS